MISRSPKLVLYAGFAAVSFLAALTLGRPELVALGAPFVLVLATGLAFPAPSPVQASLRLKTERALEGEAVEAELVVSTRAPVPALLVALSLPDGVRLDGGDAVFMLCMRGAGTRVIPVRLTGERWGAYRLGDLVLRAGDRAGLRLVDQVVRGDTPLRVYPRWARLQSLIVPLGTQPFAGNRVARAKGEGIEFADIRPYSPGDRPRRINWRASSLHGQLYVDEQHPERNSDVVLFLDSFSEARRHGNGTLDLAVRAAASLAHHHLAVGDRVGLVSFGGIVRWLAPASGRMQVYRIVEALVEAEVYQSFAWKHIDALPRRSLTPQALVIALSPLLDERSVSALFNLRRRGFDLVVVDVSPVAFTSEAEDPAAESAIRLWRLWRESLHFRYQELGVAVVEWDGRRELASVVEEVRAFRRFARSLSA